MRVETVLGSIGAESLNGVLMHEHVESISLDGLYSGGGRVANLAENALAGLRDLGVNALVDLSGRSRVESGDTLVKVLPIARRTGLHIVAGFGFYKDPWLGRAGPTDIDELTDMYVERARDMGQGLRAGIYGEIGTSLEAITAHEELHLRAVARAHVATGLAISTHCTLGTMGIEQAKVLLSEGANPEKVVIGHLDLQPDVQYLEQVLDTGVNIAFDTFGKEWFDYRVPNSERRSPGEFVKWTYHRSDSDRLEALVELCSRGYDDRIVLSCDISGLEAWLNPNTHGRYGYSYLPTVVVPRLLEAGVSEESLRRMLTDNPTKILAIP